ncbi:hypothetical protein [Actinoplanes sp. NPDC051494]|uniref:hypothetical protein n=1 Tax=Actinoplanes sp. NPDC051494 TaxID=3363907 RepID=UPI00379EE072
MADGVQIATEQVTDFAHTIRTDADDGFRSAAARGADLHHHGVVFGTAIPGETTLTAKALYAQVLENTEANLREYRRAATIFAQAAEEIARSFADADITADEAQRRVEALLSGPTQPATLSPSPHEGQQ